MPEHILSLSYGKDSLACLFAIEELGWPLDRIIHAEVWATDTIPADLPPMVEFKKKADRIIKERWGIEVEHVSRIGKDGERITYEKLLYKKVLPENLDKRLNSPTWFKRGISDIYGFPTQKGPWCNKLKFRGAIRNLGCINYAGIAADETKRIERWTGRLEMPLVKIGWDENFCYEICKENGLLSPTYTTSARGGCWFCHNQGVGQLWLLCKNYPELWALMLKWDKDSPVTFRADGHTVHDYDLRFQLEDKGYLFPEEKGFQWAMIENPQRRWF